MEMESCNFFTTKVLIKKCKKTWMWRMYKSHDFPAFDELEFQFSWY